jgi:hypothetical protein
MAVEAWLKRAKYDAQQMEIEAEQRLPENVAANRADHFFKLCRDFASMKHRLSRCVRLDRTHFEIPERR